MLGAFTVIVKKMVSQLMIFCTYCIFHQNYIVVTNWNCLIEAILIGVHNIFWYKTEPLLLISPKHTLICILIKTASQR